VVSGSGKGKDGKKKSKGYKNKLPSGVRCVVYSFLDMESLIKNISKLSIIERELITATKIMDQERLIKINTNKIDSMT